MSILRRLYKPLSVYFCKYPCRQIVYGISEGHENYSYVLECPMAYHWKSCVCLLSTAKNYSIDYWLHNVSVFSMLTSLIQIYTWSKYSWRPSSGRFLCRESSEVPRIFAPSIPASQPIVVFPLLLSNNRQHIRNIFDSKRSLSNKWNFLRHSSSWDKDGTQEVQVADDCPYRRTESPL